MKRKSFEVGDHIWKIILPIGSKDKEFRKWSPNWEKPFKVHQVLSRNAYWLASQQEEPHNKFINEKYLNLSYFPCHVGNCRNFPKELGRSHGLQGDNVGEMVLFYVLNKKNMRFSHCFLKNSSVFNMVLVQHILSRLFSHCFLKYSNFLQCCT